MQQRALTTPRREGCDDAKEHPQRQPALEEADRRFRRGNGRGAFMVSRQLLYAPPKLLIGQRIR